MGRISQKFTDLKKCGQKALVTFITAGDPDLTITEKAVNALTAAGADIIELGVPFSDPMADGPTIQRSSERAMTSATTLSKILESVTKIRCSNDVPIVLMGYYNPVLSYGLERFASDAAAAGIDGLLIVDLPPEESGELRRHLKHTDIDLIYLLTPTSDEQRIDLVSSQGSGFLYYVSVTGVTGARQDISISAAGSVTRIKGRTDIPVAVGFGISSPDQAAQMASVADGVVVGSALVSLFEKFEGDQLFHELTALTKSLKEAVCHPVQYLTPH